MFDVTGMKITLDNPRKMLHLPGAAATLVYTRPDSFFGDQVFFFGMGGTQGNSHSLETWNLKPGTYNSKLGT